MIEPVRTAKRSWKQLCGITPNRTGKPEWPTPAEIKREEAQRITTPETILDLDLRKILAKVGAKYRIQLPSKVLAVDLNPDGDLYIRFRHVDKPVGEASQDGMAVFFYGDGEGIVGLELLDLNPFS
ncbi:MAG: hypothetical protein ABSD99_13220 [Candidatus Bathyarchaeia archaeon]